MLEDLGHNVREANSGAAALQLLREQPFDLVITDQAMPKMTGMQLVEAVKAEWPKIPVILATGYAEVPGGADVKVPKLNKPFTEKDLVAILARVAG